MESVLALLYRKLSTVAIVVAIRHSATTDNDVDDDSISNNSLVFIFFNILRGQANYSERLPPERVF